MSDAERTATHELHEAEPTEFPDDVADYLDDPGVRRRYGYAVGRRVQT